MFPENDSLKFMEYFGPRKKLESDPLGLVQTCRSTRLISYPRILSAPFNSYVPPSWTFLFVAVLSNLYLYRAKYEVWLVCASVCRWSSVLVLPRLDCELCTLNFWLWILNFKFWFLNCICRWSSVLVLPCLDCELNPLDFFLPPHLHDSSPFNLNLMFHFHMQSNAMQCRLLD